MQAIVQTVYGSPDVLQLAEVSLPIGPDDGVLVRRFRDFATMDSLRQGKT